MKNKPLVFGFVSILLVCASILVGFVAFSSAPVMNESLALIGILFIGGIISAIIGTILAIKELIKGAENRTMTIVALVLDLILTPLFGRTGGIILYTLYYMNDKNFRL